MMQKKGQSTSHDKLQLVEYREKWNVEYGEKWKYCQSIII